jgi:predicted nucleic acid-binding protein
VTLPTVVVAESMTGTPIDAPVQRVLAIIASTSVPLSEILARNAGALQFAAGRPRRDTNDAIVVATADAEPNSVILTGDPDDLEVLAAVRGLSRVVSIA